MLFFTELFQYFIKGPNRIFKIEFQMLYISPVYTTDFLPQVARKAFGYIVSLLQIIQCILS